MNWGSLVFTLFGGAIGSFITHAFHIRANQLKCVPAPAAALIQTGSHFAENTADNVISKVSNNGTNPNS